MTVWGEDCVGATFCGCCETREAEIVATVPMCGERHRYPMCMDCAAPLVESGYAEDVEVLA